MIVVGILFLHVSRTMWVQKIKAASEHFIETEKKKREKAYQGNKTKKNIPKIHTSEAKSLQSKDFSASTDHNDERTKSWKSTRLICRTRAGSLICEWFVIKKKGKKNIYRASWYSCVPSARSLKTSGIGRLLVTVIEARELKACKPNGEAPPPFLSPR